MLPGPRLRLLAGMLGRPWRLSVESLQAADRQLFELAATVTVMLDRGVVDGQNTLIAQRADDHRNRVAIEQETERRLALLQLGDVGALAGGLFARFSPIDGQLHSGPCWPAGKTDNRLLRPSC